MTKSHTLCLAGAFAAAISFSGGAQSNMEKHQSGQAMEKSTNESMKDAEHNKGMEGMQKDMPKDIQKDMPDATHEEMTDTMPKDMEGMSESMGDMEEGMPEDAQEETTEDMEGMEDIKKA